MPLTFAAYAALMLARWGKTVTVAEYQRYVQETLLDHAYNERLARFDVVRDAA